MHRIYLNLIRLRADGGKDDRGRNQEFWLEQKKIPIKFGKMKATEANHILIEGYLRLLENLSPGNKLDLISKLSLSVKTDVSKRRKRFYQAYGAWGSSASADEIIQEIKSARTFNRKTEEL